MRFLKHKPLTFLLFFQALIFQQSSVVAQRTSSLAANQSASSPAESIVIDHSDDPVDAADLPFKATQFPIAREGYISLSWNHLEGATAYEVIDSQQRSQYRGSYPSAFVSGLSDGKHYFTVMAFDDSGAKIAQSIEPAFLEVIHWSRAQAFLLLGVGSIVFFSILAVIIIGSMHRETLQSGTNHSVSDTASAEFPRSSHSKDTEPQ